MTSAQAVYFEQLSKLKYGYPLWDPEPQNGSVELQIGDVGIVFHGVFSRIFNAMRPEGDPLNVDGVPEGYLPLDLGRNPPKMERLNDLPPGPLCSHTITHIHASAEVSAGVAGHGASLDFRFRCSDKQGAILITKEAIDRNFLLPNNRIVQYIRRHYKSWYQFAIQDRGYAIGIDDIMFVSGWAKTADWAVAAFTQGGNSAELSFDGNFGKPASISASFSVSHEESPILQQNSGPRARREDVVAQDSNARNARYSGRHSAVSGHHRRDQCVFFHYYMVKPRVLRTPKVIRAAAGFHEPGRSPNNDSDNGSGSESTISSQSVDVKNIPWDQQPHNPVKLLLDYILEALTAFNLVQHSDAELAVASDRDVHTLMEGRASVGLEVILAEIRPHVYVDGSGLGTIHDYATSEGDHDKIQGILQEKLSQSTSPVAGSSENDETREEDLFSAEFLEWFPQSLHGENEKRNLTIE
ncbi:predicted protein [Postia placenta Mad-698-R]|uniref:Uncharacterized protein n=1 Tax=Postia placenta MAD-698-R-SB12 TaxID=670580 RepID=A0A1X6MN23_9APHY|nr:hypothetical protein POSPLADRAFT_1157206 [Postia placenta MAD-698-R-SB12]EED78985.1 predicted protein [Postia placenta Mad-698-R]OSX57493.1 hypothetical protein POSPLADRAFT_1157206 [Postia placenta MAD-698-R-SB12]